MKHTIKYSFTALTAILMMSAASVNAQSTTSGAAEMDANHSIQSTTIVPGATPEKLMEKDDALNGKGLKLQNNIEMTDKVDAEAEIETRGAVQNDMAFTDIDTDSDGEITKTEFSNAIDADTSAESFAEFDLDQDGMLNEEEYQAYLNADLQTDLAE